MRHLVLVTLIAVGLIHLLPLSGVLGPERLATLYGIAAADPSLLILLRHRAVLFGLLGAFMVFAAFRRPLWNLALAAAFVSVAAFVALAWSVGSYNAQLARVIAVDLAALVLLAVGAIASIIVQRQR